MGVEAPSYRGFRFPGENISHCVWLYHRFLLSFREVEEMIGRSRSLYVPAVSREAVPLRWPWPVMSRFQLPPVKPCMRFSRTRLTDAVHRRHSVFPARACSPWVRRQFRSGGSVRTGPARGRRARTGRSVVRVDVASR